MRLSLPVCVLLRVKAFFCVFTLDFNITEGDEHGARTG